MLPHKPLLVWLAVGGLCFLTACRTVRNDGSSGVPSALENRRLDDADLERRAKALAAFSAGIIEQSQAQPEAALEMFTRSLENDPANEPLAVEVGRGYLAREQTGRAIEVLRRSAAQPRASGAVKSLLGLAYVQAGRTNDAIAAYQAAVQASPTLLGAYGALVQLLEDQGRLGEALKALEQAARQEVPAPAYWVDLTDLLGRFDQAEAALKEPAQHLAREALAKAEAAQVDHPMLLLRMADRYAALGDTGRFEHILLELQERFSRDPNTASRLAEFYLRSGQPAKAREQLQKLKLASPTNPMPPYYLALLAMEEEKLDEAVEMLELALLLKPDFEPPYADLAAVRISREEPALALETLAKARQHFPPSFRREYLEAVAHTGLRQFDEALRQFEAAERVAAETQPELVDHRFHFQVGALLERAGRYEDSVRRMEKCLALKPDFDEALNHLGYMWAERGENLERAHAMIEQAVKADPENAAYLDSLGWVLFKLGRPAEALPWLEKAAQRLGEPDATILDHLGDVLAALGQMQEAREAWQQSLAVEASDIVRKKLEPVP